jgi:hypothetical protein
VVNFPPLLLGDGRRPITEASMKKLAQRKKKIGHDVLLLCISNVDGGGDEVRREGGSGGRARNTY